MKIFLPNGIVMQQLKLECRRFSSTPVDDTGRSMEDIEASSCTVSILVQYIDNIVYSPLRFYTD